MPPMPWRIQGRASPPRLVGREVVRMDVAMCTALDAAEIHIAGGPLPPPAPRFVLCYTKVAFLIRLIR